MLTKITELLGIDFPLVAFSHCRDVVVQVSRAGGMGIFGAAGSTPEQLRVELAWIEEHVEGNAFGLDLIIPASHESRRASEVKTTAPHRDTTAHSQFIRVVLAEYGIDTSTLSDERLPE
jgi:hypothetical protein